MLTGQPHTLPVTAGPTMDNLPAVTASVAACSTVAVKDDRLVQSLTTGLMPREEKFFDRSKSVPDDTDGSFVKSKPMPKGVIMWYSAKELHVIILL